MISRRRLIATLPLLPLTACQPAPAFHATDLTGKSVGGEFTLLDPQGQLRSLSDFAGKAVILFFGYTSCPDICPTALSKFASLLQLADLGPDRVQVIFITLDPARDMPQRLGEYVPWFHPSFLGLWGNDDTISSLVRKFHVTSIKREVSGRMGYVIDHSAGAYVFGPDQRLRLYIGENAPLQDIADDLRRLLAGT